MMSSKQGVCLIIRNSDGRILGVSRKDDLTDFGLTGGAVEDGELPVEAAERELKEETGLSVGAIRLVDEREYGDEYVYCYVIETTGKFDDNSTLLARGEGITKWVEPHELFSGTFGDYNRTVIGELIERGLLASGTNNGNQ